MSRSPRSIGFVLSLVLASLLGTGCSPLQPDVRGEPVHVIAGVPFYPENRYWCGPASLAGVMNYYRDAPKSDAVAEKTYSPSAGGTLMADLAWYARQHDFRVRVRSGTLNQLEKLIDRNVPPLVFVRRTSLLGSYNHFMVVVGYTSRGYIVNSGLSEHQFIDRETFRSLWEGNDRYYLRVTPADASPETAGDSVQNP